MVSVNKDLSRTIEFYMPPRGLRLETYLDDLPESTGILFNRNLQAVHHLARYLWAAKVLANRPAGRILDVACGAGYGSYILAQSLPQMQVIGGDYDPRAASFAREHFEILPNLDYRTVDAVSWTGGDGLALGRFDVIVSFDTIEHLSFREIALVNFAENLEMEGALLFSTPCRHRNLLNPEWEHHKIEYSASYLHNLIRRFFSDVRIPDNKSLPGMEFWDDVVNRNGVVYLNKINPIYCAAPIQFGL